VSIQDEKILVAALKQSDRSAIDAIFLKYHTLLCRVAYRILSDAEESKDVVQEVFIKLWQNRMELNIQYSLEAYLRRAVINTALNRVESKRRVATDSLDFTGIARPEPVVHQQTDYAELSARIDQALNNLPPRTRAVFTLIRFEEMSYKEVADTLDISTKAVEKEMMKALRLLRNFLREFLPLLLLSVLAGT
jgi:RNA polymerase sigma-70 factor (ECF subfamily)